MDDAELERLLYDLESDRVERKASNSDRDKICQAICAFANDLPNNRQPGVLFVGVNDDSSCANLPITDRLLTTLSDWRSNGNILPFPSMIVQKRVIRGCELVVVIVEPSYDTPVRYEGRTWVRVGPRRAVATVEEERRLAEKRRSRDIPFDLHPISFAILRDLDDALFYRTYLPAAIPGDIIEQNGRSYEQQLASMRFITPEPDHTPTVLGLLVVGKDPREFVPGAYIQFLRIDGTELTDPIKDQKEIDGPLPDLLRRLDEILELNISIATDITSQPTEIRQPDYPIVALQQLARNAILHRTYEWTNAPVRITWFSDRIEIQNPGGPFGQVNQENFGKPGIADYRNLHLAEAMKNLGYIQRFGIGIALARRELEKNSSPQPEFTIVGNYVLATVRRRP
ncbi:MAG TPA: ATP-binding protein [Ktedonobacteraceae bacterium]|nr:ATP-binding protein [Ktedonobacteraceae bacterium]